MEGMMTLTLHERRDGEVDQRVWKVSQLSRRTHQDPGHHRESAARVHGGVEITIEGIRVGGGRRVWRDRGAGVGALIERRLLEMKGVRGEAEHWIVRREDAWIAEVFRC